MKIWKNRFSGVMAIKSESESEAESAILDEFLFLKKLELGYNLNFASEEEFTEPQLPCPDCLWDGRHHA